MLFGVKFDFASDDQAVEGIKDALKLFLSETVGDTRASDFDGFSFAETAEGKQQCHSDCIHTIFFRTVRTRGNGCVAVGTSRLPLSNLYLTFQCFSSRASTS